MSWNNFIFLLESGKARSLVLELDEQRPKLVCFQSASGKSGRFWPDRRQKLSGVHSARANGGVLQLMETTSYCRGGGGTRAVSVVVTLVVDVVTCLFFISWRQSESEEETSKKRSGRSGRRNRRIGWGGGIVGPRFAGPWLVFLSLRGNLSASASRSSSSSFFFTSLYLHVLLFSLDFCFFSEKHFLGRKDFPSLFYRLFFMYLLIYFFFARVAGSCLKSRHQQTAWVDLKGGKCGDRPLGPKDFPQRGLVTPILMHNGRFSKDLMNFRMNSAPVSHSSLTEFSSS